MACPFSSRRFGDGPHQPHGLLRQASIVDGSAAASSAAAPSSAACWTLDDDCADVSDDALTLTHLQLAIQLLTSPSVCRESGV